MKGKSINRKKLEEKNLVQTIIWLVSIIALLIIIFVPKDITLTKILFFSFIALYFISPTILSIYHIKSFHEAKLKFNTPYLYVPFLGMSGYIFIIYFYFLNSINTTGQNIISPITFAIVGYNIACVCALKYKRMYSFKTHSILLLIAYLLFIILFFVNVVISYYFSVKW